MPRRNSYSCPSRQEGVVGGGSSTCFTLRSPDESTGKPMLLVKQTHPKLSCVHSICSCFLAVVCCFCFRFNTFLSHNFFCSLLCIRRLLPCRLLCFILLSLRCVFSSKLNKALKWLLVPSPLLPWSLPRPPKNHGLLRWRPCTVKLVLPHHSPSSIRCHTEAFWTKISVLFLSRSVLLLSLSTPCPPAFCFKSVCFRWDIK
mmetsp:Transcript_26564/g.43674  ORF Transcript_26564/g.43674 Transcript_26564/m.43674 type:complete len:201 (-) Transcript_26564:2005-2607(-)